jgi:hypothetical protein
MNYRELFAALRKRPGIYGLDGSFAQFCIFLNGCNAATSWSLLAGFNEWLLVRYDEETSFGWTALIKCLAFPERRRFDHETGAWLDRSPLDLRNASDNARAVDTLFQLLDEFLELRERPQGLMKIIREYVAWLDGYRAKRDRDNIPRS